MGVNLSVLDKTLIFGKILTEKYIQLKKLDRRGGEHASGP